MQQKNMPKADFVTSIGSSRGNPIDPESCPFDPLHRTERISARAKQRDRKAIFHGSIYKEFVICTYSLPGLWGIFVDKDPLFIGHRPLHFNLHFDF
jgi:hypothetical protein